MGSVGLTNNGLLGAFNVAIYTEGLDLGRCQIAESLGVYVADPANTFRAGMLVGRNTSGLVVPWAGAADVSLLGVAKWNHCSSVYAAVVDEPIVLTGTDTISLKHPTVSAVRVNSATTGTGTTYTAGGVDYTLNATNGTVTRVGGGAIADGQTVYVTYTFAVTAADMSQVQGLNFWNNMDEVSQQDGRITVITSADLLFTSQYVTSANYAVNTALYGGTAGNAGLFTSVDPGGGSIVARVFQTPTASDPFLGLRFRRQPSI